MILSVALLSLFMLGAKAQENKYYFSKTLDVSTNEAIEKIKTALKEEGFGVVSESHMDRTLMEKIPDLKMDPYIVLGACNAKYARKVIEKEPNIGMLLPCKIVIRHLGKEQCEVAIINPSVAMSVVGNEELTPIFDEISIKLKKVLKVL